jgi:hypothetical protein
MIEPTPAGRGTIHASACLVKFWYNTSINEFVMKKIFFLFSMLVAYSTNSQTPLWQWINIAGGGGNIYTNGYLESVRQMGTDAFGNIYAISSISSFGPTIDTIYKQHGFAYDDFVVFSYRCDGSFRWARFFGSSNNDLPGGLVVNPQWGCICMWSCCGWPIFRCTLWRYDYSIKTVPIPKQPLSPNSTAQDILNG